MYRVSKLATTAAHDRARDLTTPRANKTERELRAGGSRPRASPLLSEAIGIMQRAWNVLPMHSCAKQPTSGFYASDSIFVRADLDNN